jgi:hypothetical protein
MRRTATRRSRTASRPLRVSRSCSAQPPRTACSSTSSHLPDARTFASIVGKPGVVFGGPYQKHLKLGGVKSIVDGSAQARTAFFGEPMKVFGPAGQRNWRGEPVISQTELDATFRLAYQNHVQTY